MQNYWDTIINQANGIKNLIKYLTKTTKLKKK